MNSSDVNIFVDATVQTFQMMCASEPKRDGKLYLRHEEGPGTTLLGIIGLNGRLKGAAMLTMEFDTAETLCEKFTGEAPESQEETMDSLGELINILAGAASANIPGVELTLPAVIKGEWERIVSLHGYPWVVIPFSLDDVGTFNLEVNLEEDD